MKSNPNVEGANLIVHTYKERVEEAGRAVRGGGRTGNESEREGGVERGKEGDNASMHACVVLQASCGVEGEGVTGKSTENATAKRIPDARTSPPPRFYMRTYAGPS